MRTFLACGAVFLAVLPAPLPAAAPAPSPADQVLAEGQALCGSTHADPVQVRAAALARGYLPAPDAEGSLEPGWVRAHPSQRLTKAVGGDVLAVSTSEDIVMMSAGMAQDRRCTVVLQGAVAADMAARARALLGAEPSGSGEREQWWYLVPGGAEPAPLTPFSEPALSAALSAGPVYRITASTRVTQAAIRYEAFRMATPADLAALPKPSVITQPPWIRKPSGDDMRRDYPAAAFEGKVEGRVVIDCVVTGEGALTNCAVVEEAPTGQGFGAASVRVASRFRMRKTTVDGAPVGGAHVRIPLNWWVD